MSKWQFKKAKDIYDIKRKPLHIEYTIKPTLKESQEQFFAMQRFAKLNNYLITTNPK